MWLSFNFQLYATPTGHVILALKGLVNVKFTLDRHKGPEAEQMYSSTLSLTFALDGDGWSTPHPGCFNTGTELEPFLGDWVGPRVGLQGCGKSHLSLGIRFPDCPSNRKLLYQLCCTNVIIKTQKSKFNFQIILTAVYCTSNYPLFALCTSYSA